MVARLKQEHERLRVAIIAAADPEYRRGSLMVAPTEQRVHGARTPHLRQLAKSWHRANRQAAPDEVLALVESLWDGESRDERVLGLMILWLHPEIVAGLERARFDRWRADIDNWGTCDIVAGILGTWAMSSPENRLPYLEELVGDRDMWSRRLGLVASVPLNRASNAHSSWTLSQVDRVLDHREQMITKAVSWVLRTMTKHDAAAVEAYVQANADRMAALPRREVRNKLRTGRKSGRAG
mgnify:CR=1 FL=1